MSQGLNAVLTQLTGLIEVGVEILSMIAQRKRTHEKDPTLQQAHDTMQFSTAWRLAAYVVG